LYRKDAVGTYRDGLLVGVVVDYYLESRCAETLLDLRGQPRREEHRANSLGCFGQGLEVFDVARNEDLMVVPVDYVGAVFHICVTR